MSKLLFIGIPVGVVGVAGLALYAAAYFYVRRYRNIFKNLGIPYIPTNNWTGLWALYTNTDDIFELERSMVKKNGGIYGAFEGRHPVLVVSDLELVRQILLKDFDSFTDRRNAGKIRKRTVDFTLPTLTGERWKHVRQQVTPAFTPQALRRMQPLIWKTVGQLSENIKNHKEELDIKMFCGYYALDVIASVAFGMELDSFNNQDNPFVTNAKQGFSFDFTTGIAKHIVSLVLMFPFLFTLIAKMTPDDSKMMAPALFFQKIIEDEMKRRRAAAGGVERPDFLQMVMHLEKDPKDPSLKDNLAYDEYGLPWPRNGLTHEEIVAQAILFFIAGYETTSSTLSLVLFSLAQNPECQEKLYEEIITAFPEELKESPSLDAISELKYIEMCINETLRHYPPLLRHERTCTKDTMIGGFHIPKDMIVLIPMHAIHHDPNWWPEPEKFDPERFSPENSSAVVPSSFMPFGLGNRHCIGMRLALVELKVALIPLIRRFRFEVSPKTKLPLKWKSSLFRYSTDTIYLRATLR